MTKPIPTPRTKAVLGTPHQLIRLLEVSTTLECELTLANEKLADTGFLLKGALSAVESLTSKLSRYESLEKTQHALEEVLKPFIKSINHLLIHVSHISTCPCYSFKDPCSCGMTEHAQEAQALLATVKPETKATVG